VLFIGTPYSHPAPADTLALQHFSNFLSRAAPCRLSPYFCTNFIRVTCISAVRACGRRSQARRAELDPLVILLPGLALRRAEEDFGGIRDGMGRLEAARSKETALAPEPSLVDRARSTSKRDRGETERDLWLVVGVRERERDSWRRVVRTRTSSTNDFSFSAACIDTRMICCRSWSI
jgi:hypothetical protein